VSRAHHSAMASRPLTRGPSPISLSASWVKKAATQLALCEFQVRQTSLGRTSLDGPVRNMGRIELDGVARGRGDTEGAVNPPLLDGRRFQSKGLKARVGLIQIVDHEIEVGGACGPFRCGE